MIEWLAEINWIMLIMVTAGVMAGMELGRRKAEAKGEVYSFLPRPMHRLFSLGTVLSGVLFVESARIAVGMPTAFHVWMLLFVTAAAFILFGASLGLELESAKKYIHVEDEGENDAVNLD